MRLLYFEIIMMGKRFVSLRCVIWIVLLISPVVNAQGVCDVGWFGSDCQYKCHCTNNNCDNNGDCRDGDTCVKGWFGPQCQYVDLTYTEGYGTTKEVFTDADDTTCNDNMNQMSGTLILNRAFPVTWLRLHFSIAGVLQRIDVYFRDDSTGAVYQCNNKRSAVVDSRTIDIHCDISTEVNKILYAGEAVGYLCSIYVSGGRNIALKQRQVSQLLSAQNVSYSAEASNAVDGDTNQTLSSGSCTFTADNRRVYLFWDIQLTQLSDVNRYVLYNRGDCCQERLKGFLLESVDQNDVAVFSHIDRTTTAQLVYDITTANNTSSIKKVTILIFFNQTQEFILTLCEVEIFGDSHCPAGKYGRECDQDCNCATVNDQCFVSTGGCPSGCAEGYSGENCVCPINKYGPRCIHECSTNCDNQQCEGTTGRCVQCPAGKNGDQCDQDCPPIHYGPRCVHPCSTNCVDSKCEGSNGRCLDCPCGWNGDQCNQECPPTTYGPRCIHKCSSNCLDSKCDGITGICDRCSIGKYGDLCDKEMCPGDFCQNGGRCAGLKSCDCLATDFYGERCQYKKETIPLANYKLLDIVNDTIITTSGNNMKVTGNVTLNKDGEEVSMAIPARSFVTVDDPIRESCLDNIDDCQSGFSLTTGHSFSAVDASELQVAMTTGAGLEDGVRGVSLYYKSGQVHSYVITSTQEWSIAKDFQLVVNKWYDMTVSWSADQGLALLQGSDVIGSSQTPSKLSVPANISKPLTIGYPGVTSSAVMNVKGMTTVPLFWKEVQRSGIMFAKTSASEDSDKDFVEMLGIGIGSGAAVILTIVAVIIAVLIYRRKRNSVPLSPSASTMKGPDYITPSDHPYSEGSINTYADYLNPVYHDNTPANDYDYIGNDYLTIIEDPNFGDGMTVPPVSNKDVEHAYSRHIDSGDQN